MEKKETLKKFLCLGVNSHNISRFSWQFLWLVYKNFKLQLRRPLGTVIELFLPVVAVTFIIVLRHFLEFQHEELCFTTYDPDQLTIAERRYPTWRTAVYISYAPENPVTGEIMDIFQREVRRENDFNLVVSSYATEKDLLKERNDFSGNESTRMNFCFQRGAAVIFNNLDGDELSYTIRLHHEVGNMNSWNTILTSPNFEHPGHRATNLYLSEGFLHLQKFVGNAIIEWKAKSKNLSYSPVKVYVRQLPYPEYSRDEFLSSINIILPLLFVLTFLYTAGVVVKELVLEKETRIREYMLMMGLRQWILWATWFVKQILFLFPSVIILTFLVKFFLFVHTDWFIVFIFLFLYMLSMISFSFFVSVWFNSARLGLIVGFITWFGSFSPFLFLVFRYRSTAFVYIFLACLLSNTALGFGIEIITRLEQQTVGITWNNIAEPITMDETFNMAWVFLMLVIDSILYLTLTWYVNEVKPGKYGVPKPPYFLFLPSYWCTDFQRLTSKSKRIKNLQSLVWENPSAHEKVRGKPAVGISIRNLTKVYRTWCNEGVRKRAVNNLNLDVYKGEITALLGHNGAGKTTTMSILTGLLTPTEGTAMINGYSILTDMDLIRENLGICPQHNILFNRLTVKEHLSFFMYLKGVHDRNVVRDEVNQMIEDLLLSDKANTLVSHLSGGMKRKLSLGIALIGGSEVVILDEPTAGMDPYARRATWDLLGKHKLGRCILMSTHLMDEADLLGDRIAIMTEGKLCCSGSSLFLKSRYGVGYHMTLVKELHCVSSAVVALIKSFVPSAQKVTDVGMELSFILPSSEASKFPDLFEKLESTKESLGIAGFGISITTMEEVFLKVGEGNEKELKSTMIKKHSITTMEAAKIRKRKLKSLSEVAGELTTQKSVRFSSKLVNHHSDIAETHHDSGKNFDESYSGDMQSVSSINQPRQSASNVTTSRDTSKDRLILVQESHLKDTSSTSNQNKTSKTSVKKIQFDLDDHDKEELKFKSNITNHQCIDGKLKKWHSEIATRKPCPKLQVRSQSFYTTQQDKSYSLCPDKQRNIIFLPPLDHHLVINVASVPESKPSSCNDDKGRKRSTIALPPIQMTLIHSLKLDHNLSGCFLMDIQHKLQPLPPIPSLDTVGPLKHDYELSSVSDDNDQDHELAYDYEPNKGFVLWLQQFRAMLIKRFYYSSRFYRSLVIQLIFPILFSIIGLLVVLNYPVESDPPRNLHISTSGLNARDITLFYAELDGMTMNFSNFRAEDLSVTHYVNITAKVIALRNSVNNISNVNECCNYKYQLLDKFCASRNTIDLEHCKDKNSLFGYSRCPDCLKCCFAYGNVRSCSHPITKIGRSQKHCPSPPSLSLHEEPIGPLNTINTFVIEYILRLASQTGAVPFFNVYQAGITVAAQDPIISACDCTKVDGKSVRGCGIVSILNERRCDRTKTCPTLIATGTSRCGLLLFNESLCRQQPICYNVEPYSVDYIRFVTCIRENIHCKLGMKESNSTKLSNQRSVSTVHPEYIQKPAVTVWYNNGPFHVAPAAFNTYQNMLLQMVTGNKNLSMTVINHPLPRDLESVAQDPSQQFLALGLSVLTLFGYSFFLANFVVFFVNEKESKSKHLQFVSGVGATTYWLSAFTLDLANAIIPVGLTIIVFRIFPVNAYRGTALTCLFLILVMTCWASIPFTYMLSLIFKSSLAAFSALLVIFFFITVLLLIAVFLVQLYGKENKEEISDSLHYSFLLNPTYGLASTVHNILVNQQKMDFCQQHLNVCEHLNITYVENILIFDSPGIGVVCVYLSIEGTVFIVMTVLLELKCFFPRFQQFYMRFLKERHPKIIPSGEAEDEDVYAERKRVVIGDTKRDLVIIKNLVKTYHTYFFGCSFRSSKTAVNGICLGIPRGECFGLLGVNGAGKTTTFSILTGDIKMTSGTAVIDEQDIRTSMTTVRQGMGYCPQFDALIECMTACEQLWMYARLHGVPEHNINEVVNLELRRLDLMKYGSKRCGTFSGGVKRKLSTAIAMIGNPPILLLDEPTNGMDPNTRRYLWDVLSKIMREGKSIILTSHSMEECEALCNRLAIMVNGQFKCLGSIQHLKNKFGSGITLQAKIKHNFTMSIHERSEINTERQRLFSIQPVSTRRKSSVFSWNYIKKRATSLTTEGILKSFKSTQSSTNVPNLYDTTVFHDFIKSHFSGATLMEEHVGAVTYWLPSHDISWSSIFRLLEENKEHLGILDYSVSQTTLEQVFVNFAKEQEEHIAH